ncbi:MULTISPECIES: hypothetical protein [unclassified Mesorhizobium]|uniref:hypothetical protein n=1 Tax=unclassified Mesorhizobium TaxID=325217 RepID=UPI000FCB3704|nr:MULTISPECIES: hypothetical protein [unclassified Mesorhizobium]RVD54543.1 hypothetical protein EN783_30400 [Mesorhizobium sp. M2D.F.Ca.ET.140.01.1.1]TGP69396.1 hypothetical protein EN867_30980 [Mesorhizobium sp. M2D.F.Ca.ET.224.01.1.1]TGP86616.1 hypothetical protein EN865_30975 [bacterium M00.F.Ca.ET.222.01.1.1]
MPSNDKQKPATPPDRVAFDYIKSQFFRVIRADGAIGAITPNGHIHFALYSERAAIPRRIVQELDAAGHLGTLIDSETETRGSIVREMDVDVFLTLESAISLRDWLTQRIDELKAGGLGSMGGPNT